MQLIKLLTKCLFIGIFSLSISSKMESVCNLGSLSNRQNYGLPSDSYPQSIAFSPIFNGNLFAAVANSNTNYLSTYSVDQTTGTFTEISSSIGTGGGPSGVAFSPITSEEKLFAAVSNSGGSVTVYGVDQSGNFIAINTYNAGSQPSSIAFSPITPNGNLFSAVTNGGTSGSNGVTVYIVNQDTGVFSPVGNYATGGQPSSVAFSPIMPNGDLFAAVANYASNNISFYQVDTSTGVFNSLGNYQSSSTASCISVAFSPVTPNGNLFVAVSNSSFTDNSVTIYQVNIQNLSLNFVGTYVTGSFASPHGVAFSSIVSGSLFLGVANQLSSNISMYMVDQSAGTLTSVANYATNQYPYSIAFSPLTTTGYLFLGTANYGGNNITVYSVETAPTASITVSSSNVCVGSSIMLTVVALGGSENYTYSWTLPDGGTSSDNPLIISSVTSSDGGSYQVTVTDSNGCQGISDQVQVTVYSGPEVMIQPSNILSTCAGESVTFTAVPSGGSGNFAYQWFDSNGDLVSTTNILSPDTGTAGIFDYSFQLTDTITQCTVGVTLIQLIVNSNPTVAISSVPATACYGGNAILTANVSVGSGSYSYQWLLNGSPITNATSSTYIANDIIPGTNDGIYQVTVIDTTTACSITSSDFTILVDQVSVTLNASSTAVCQGASITLTANVTSGTPTYNYEWYQNGSLLSTTSDNTYTINDLSAGNYTYQVTVIDSNSCQGNSNSVLVTVNPNPTVTISSVPTTACYGGNATLTANVNPSGMYSYTWTLNGSSVGTGPNLTVSDIITGANDGVYQVTVTDTVTACSTTSSPFTIPVYQVAVTLNASSIAVCQGASITLTANVTSGVPTYSYEWYQNGSLLSTTSDNTYTINNLSAGTYTYQVAVIDSNYCQGNSNSVSVTVKPTPLVTIMPNPAVVCLGSDIILMAHSTEGSGNYTTYAWTFNEIPIGTNSSTLTIDNASDDNAGIYQVMVTDSNGCQASSTTTLTVDTVNVNVSPSVTTICSGGNLTLTATVTSGVAPYTYRWVGPNGYTATGNPITRSNLSSLDTGTYSVIVTDFNSCTGMATSQVIVDTVNVTVLPFPDSVCLGSTVTLTVNAQGGTAPYSYSWTGPNGFTSTYNPVIIPNVTLSDAGSYTATATDANGCSGTDSSIVNVGALTVNVLPDPGSICIGSTITLTANVQGGTAPYSYSWTGPNGFTSTDNPVIISNANASNTGTYQVTVRDVNGCMGSDSSIVNVGDLTVNVLPDPATVCRGSTVTLTANVAGGLSPYSYNWTGPNDFTSTSNPVIIPNASPSNAGTYQVTVTDFNGCTGTNSSEVTIDNVNVTVTPNPDTVCIDSTVILTANVSSGTFPYTYQWTGPNNYTFTGNPAVITNIMSSKEGTYQVIVTDAMGCQGQSTSQVIVDQLNVSVLPSILSTCPGSAINLKANVSSGIAPYTYQWTGPHGFSSTDQNISIDNVGYVNAGIYQVTVTDSKGCTGTSSAQVNLEAIKITITPTPAVVAPGSSITLRADVICGQGPFIYQWTGPNGFTSNSPIITINNANGLNMGTYTLTVTDAHGDKATEEVDVFVDNLSVGIVSNTLNIRQGQTIVLTAAPNGGQSPYTYQWFGPAVTRSTSGQLISTDQTLIVDDATTANSGIYTVMVMDTYGFTASDTINVNVRATSSLSSAIVSKYCCS